MSDEPVEAARAEPGVFFLASEHVELGMRFRAGGALYEVVTNPRKWGAGWVANVEVLEGLRPGIVVPNAMLHPGKRVK